MTTSPDQQAVLSSKMRGLLSAQGSSALLQISGADEARIGPLIALPRVLVELGANPHRVFAQAGVNLQLFRSRENRIPREALGRLLATCADLTQRPDIGLLVGGRSTLTDFGDIGSLMQNSATVGEALRALVMHLHIHDRFAVPVLLGSESSYTFLGYSPHMHAMPGTAHLHDAAIAVAHRILLQLCGASFKPMLVQFSHVSPDDARAYRKLFSSGIRFNAELSGISFTGSWLEQPIAGADLNLRASLSRAIVEAQDRTVLSFAEEVQRVLQQMLLSGSVSAANVARLFGIRERTLRQRLQKEGTSLQQLVTKTRFELAKQLLQYTQLAITEIAATLCYADAAVFSRAFRHWTGVSPRQWRSKESA